MYRSCVLWHFKKVESWFLIMQHTYEDNDKLFSTISFHLTHTKFAVLTLFLKSLECPQWRYSTANFESTLASEEINKQYKRTGWQEFCGQLPKIWSLSCSFVQNSLVKDNWILSKRLWRFPNLIWNKIIFSNLLLLGIIGFLIWQVSIIPTVLYFRSNNVALHASQWDSKNTMS